MQHTEEWKDVVGWEDMYSVSSEGRVYSKHTKTLRKPRTEKLGYLSVDLWNNNYMKRLKVHRMVAQAFIVNPENKPQVNHKDGDKANNKLSNLEWATAKENSQHAYSNKLSRPTVGARHGRSKLTELEAFFIKHSELPNKDLATEFGVSQRLIRKIKQGELWKCLTKLEENNCNNP